MRLRFLWPLAVVVLLFPTLAILVAVSPFWLPDSVPEIAAARRRSDLWGSDGWLCGVTQSRGLVPYVAIALAAASVGREFRFGTIAAWVTCGHRDWLVPAKLVVCNAIVAAVIVGSAAFSVATTVVLTREMDVNFGWEVAPGAALALFANVALSSAGWSAAAALIAVWRRSGSQAFVLCVVYRSAEPLIASTVDLPSSVLPGHVWASVRNGGDAVYGYPLAVVAGAAFTIAAAVAATKVLRHADAA